MYKQNIISKHIGILCAMPEEIGSTLDNLRNIETKTYGDLRIYSGDWCFSKTSFKSLNLHLSIAWSGWGKVSAARAATRLICHHFKELKIDAIFFTGVAGAINSNLKQWDIVVPYELIQHDLDARPLFNNRLHKFGTAIFTAIVHDHDFRTNIQARKDWQYMLKEYREHRPFIENRNHQRK